MNLSPRIAAITATLVATFSLVSNVPSVAAHPLGNLTVNTAAQIVVAPEQTTVTYILDLAELPTVQERPEIEEAGESYAADKCAALAGGVRLTSDADALDFSASSAAAELLPGQGGLETTRVECVWAAPGIENAAALTWNDDNFVDRLGWREVVMLGDGVTLTSDLPTSSTSALLTAYPDDVAAPRVLTGSATVQPGGARLDESSAPRTIERAADAQGRGASGLTRRFNSLVAERELTFGIGVLAAVLAFVLGAFHALAPGHGKTLMAAMVASRRGTPRQLAALGGTVAVTHTAGVVVLGVIVTTSQVIAPDEVMPWLTIISGALLLGVGSWMLARRLVNGPSVSGHHHGIFAHAHHGHPHHGHAHHQDHPHHEHEHEHEHGNGNGNGNEQGHEHPTMAPVRTRSLALIGMAGGIVPTPSALVVLLGATALGRAWFGVALVGVYGIGMAATLIAAGYALVRLQSWIEHQYAEARWLRLGIRALPLATALGLVVGGVSLAVRGAASV